MAAVSRVHAAGVGFDSGRDTRNGGAARLVAVARAATRHAAVVGIVLREEADVLAPLEELLAALGEPQQDEAGLLPQDDAAPARAA